MEMRRFGKDGASVSLLGFGCMRLPTVNGVAGDIDVELGGRMVDYAIERGVNYFDTAYPYHDGKSEAFIGRALAKHPRDSFYLATKFPIWLAGSAADLERIFSEQLERTGVEYFDFYLAHNLNAAFYQKYLEFGCHEFFERKKREGRIRRFGFSFHDNPAALDKVVRAHDWDFAQIMLNYLDWDDQDAKGQYEILLGAGLPTIVMEPVRGGALASLTPEAVDVFRRADPAASPASWALRFAGSLENVLTVLSGMSDFSQVEDNVRTFSPFRPLTTEDRAAIAAALVAYRRANPIPCTACGYCMPCPVGVDIPRSFASYNHYKSTNYKEFFQLTYNAIEEPNRPDKCVRCGECAPKCPQFLDIPDRLAEVVREAAEAFGS